MLSPYPFHTIMLWVLIAAFVVVLIYAMRSICKQIKALDEQDRELNRREKEEKEAEV